MTGAAGGATGSKPRIVKAPGTPPPGADSYATLFTVQFRHSYYNAFDGKCPDFAIVPTGECAAMMARLGMSWRDQGDGFSVYIPQGRMVAMTDAMRKARDSGTAQLTFFMVLKNSDFVGITALPIDTSPMQQNFYVTNLQISPQRDALLLGDGGSLGASSLYPVTNGAISLLSRSGGTVTAFNMAGKPVALVRTYPGQPATLSLAGLPHGSYRIAGSPRRAYTGPPQMAYVPTSPLTSGVIDLVLARPEGTATDPAAFPVSLPAAPGAAAIPPRTVNLVAQFEARETYWQYYVVSHASRGDFGDDLSISGAGSDFRKSTNILPNGDAAVLFSAETPLPMRQRALYQFSLSGERRGVNGSRNHISVDHLPAAPTAPVWPAVGHDVLTGNSEIFVYV